jgi:serine/threonine protein kinase
VAKAIDKRTDVWAFGCVLYESLTGSLAFGGETISDSVAKILEREPDWGKLPKETPARLKNLLGRCLHKNPVDRLRDIISIAVDPPCDQRKYGRRK